MVVKRILSIVHGDSDPPGLFEQVATEQGFACDEWFVSEEPRPAAELDAYAAAAIFGGYMNVHEESRLPWLREEKRWIRQIVDRAIPALGICLGAQLLAEAAGAEIRPCDPPEIGWRTIDLIGSASNDPLFHSLHHLPSVFEWHSWSIDVPDGAIPLARSAGALQAFRLGASIWGLQFHAEVTPDKLAEWLAGAATDPDAIRAGVNPASELSRSDSFLPGSTALGRLLFTRFLCHVDALASVEVTAR